MLGNLHKLLQARKGLNSEQELAINLKEIKNLLSDQEKVGLEDKNEALIYFSKIGEAELVKILLDKGANINLATGRDNTTALMACCEFGHEEVLNVFLDHGMAIYTNQNDRDETAISLAAKNGHEAIIERLLKNLLSREITQIVNLPDYLGNTPLHYASGRGEEKMVRVFLDKGAIDSQNLEGETARDLAQDFPNIVEAFEQFATLPKARVVSTREPVALDVVTPSSTAFLVVAQPLAVEVDRCCTIS